MRIRIQRKNLSSTWTAALYFYLLACGLPVKWRLVCWHLEWNKGGWLQMHDSTLFILIYWQSVGHHIKIQCRHPGRGEVQVTDHKTDNVNDFACTVGWRNVYFHKEMSDEIKNCEVVSDDQINQQQLLEVPSSKASKAFSVHEWEGGGASANPMSVTNLVHQF